MVEPESELYNGIGLVRVRVRGLQLHYYIMSYEIQSLACHMQGKITSNQLYIDGMRAF